MFTNFQLFEYSNAIRFLKNEKRTFSHYVATIDFTDLKNDDFFSIINILLLESYFNNNYFINLIFTELCIIYGSSTWFFRNNGIDIVVNDNLNIDIKKML